MKSGERPRPRTTPYSRTTDADYRSPDHDHVRHRRAACRPADSGAGFPAADRAAIERVADSQQVLFNAGKFDEAVALIFAEDAVSLPPNAPAVVGRPAIQAYMKTFPPFRDFSMTPQLIDGRGDLAVVHGNYAMTLSVPGSPAGQKDVLRARSVMARGRAGDGARI